MKGRIRIVSDSDPQNPRTAWDNFGKMVCFHKRYRLGDKTDLRSDSFASWNELHDHLINECGAVVVLPMFMMDHSGLSIRTTTSDFSACDPQGWDWGQIGFIYATAEAIKECFGDGAVGAELLEKVKSNLVSEVEVYDAYVSGRVYGYVVESMVLDPNLGEELSDEFEEVDSCYGFYGDDIEKNGIKDSVQHWLDQGYEIVKE